MKIFGARHPKERTANELCCRSRYRQDEVLMFKNLDSDDTEGIMM